MPQMLKDCKIIIIFLYFSIIKTLVAKIPNVHRLEYKGHDAYILSYNFGERCNITDKTASITQFNNEKKSCFRKNF